MSQQKVNELDPKDITAIPINQLSTSFNKEGVDPDPNWFGKICRLFKGAIDVLGNPKTLAQKFLSFLSDVYTGAVAGAGIGGFGGSFFGPAGSITGAVGGAIVGGIAGAFIKPVSGLIRFAQNNIMAVTNAFKIAGTVGLFAAYQAFTGRSVGDALLGVLNTGDFIYDFNFDIPDSQIWRQIKGIIDSLYGQAGDFLGGSFARLIFTGALSPPKIEIDIRGISLAYSEFADDKREELLQGISSFAAVGINAAKQIAFLFAFLQGRDAFKKFVDSSPDLKKVNPSLAKFAQEWGDEENPRTKEAEVKDWRISTFVENKFEDIRKTFGNQIGDFIENFVESFFEESKELLEDAIIWKFT